MSKFHVEQITFDAHDYDLITVDNRIILRDSEGREHIAELDPAGEYYLSEFGEVHVNNFPNIRAVGEWMAACSADVI